MSWKENRAERKLMMLEQQKQKLMMKLGDNQREYPGDYQQRPQKHQRNQQYHDRQPEQRQFKQPQRRPDETVDEMKERLGRIAEETLRNMPNDLRPTEVLFVITIMIKMVCLLIDEN